MAKTPNNPARIGQLSCGTNAPLLLIAGPCVLESRDLAFQVAERVRPIAERLGWGYVFKGSFDKANRTSARGYRGPGIHDGLRILEEVRDRLALPVTTDIHECVHARPAAEVCELLQIPAFLARQTDLLLAAAETGKAVNVKKGQFMAPRDMGHVVAKLIDGGCENVLLTERGTFFGYGMLVNDFRALPRMRQTGAPVIFDGTHSVQFPSGAGDASGGEREMVPYLLRAAVAVGVDGIFLETHPDPDHAKSDGPNMIPLDALEGVLSGVERIRAAAEP